MLTQKWMPFAGLLVIAGLVLGACTTPAAPVATQQPEKVTVVVTEPAARETVVVVATPQPTRAAPKAAVLRINVGTYPDIIDPQKSSFVNEIAHLQLVYEGLTRLDTKLETVAGAADRWEYNQDATQVTFHIREGLQYSDGTPLNAKRFEYAILRNIDPHTAGEYAAITDDIVGAAAWRSADLTTATDDELAALRSAVGVQALDAAGNPCQAGADGYAQDDCRALQIKTNAPAPYLHTVLSLWVTYPVKEESITAGGEQWWNSSVFQIGNGPFVLKHLEPFVRAYFTPNSNYWRGQAAYDIEYKYITDGAVSFEAYKNGEFDMVPYGAEDLAQIEGSETLKQQALLYPGSCTISIMFHMKKEPFTDQKVREAFAYALDREAWARDVDGGLSLPTLTWIPAGYPGYDAQEERYGYDPEKARQALAESSYGGPDKLPEIKLTYPDSARNRTRMEWLAAQWMTVLDVSVVLDPVDPTYYTELTKNQETAPAIYRLGWCADYPDPQNWLSVYWKTGGFGERIGYSNPEFDKLVTEADAELDPVKRMTLYAEAQKLLISDVPMAVMHNTTNHYMVQPWVKGVASTPQDSAWPGSVDPLAISIDTSLIP